MTTDNVITLGGAPVPSSVLEVERREIPEILAVLDRFPDLMISVVGPPAVDVGFGAKARDWAIVIALPPLPVPVPAKEESSVIGPDEDPLDDLPAPIDGALGDFAAGRRRSGR